MIPRTVFEEDHEILRRSVREFLLEEAVPHNDRWEEQGQVDRKIWLQAGEMGLLCPDLPEDLGGLGLDFRANAVVNEEIWRLGLSGIGWPLHSDIAAPYITRYGTDEAKAEYLPGCVSGEIITALGLTEPGAGSDLQGISTTAVEDGDHFVLNGSKTFITNGQLSDLVVLAAKTDPAAGAKGISVFLVETASDGFTKGTNLKKVGMKAQDTSEQFLVDVRVPKRNLLGQLNAGFGYLMSELAQERISVALGAVAGAEAVLEQTVAYVQERKAFGKTIAAFQNTQFKLAEMDTDISLARTFLDRCLELLVAGKLDAATAAKAKLSATEVYHRVCDECVQLFGGYGYMWEYPVARAWADSRVQRIYAGSNEVMKLIIGRDLLKG
ncbi:acyl-CoA dehydrogenase [Acidobacteria bacterium Mor1]|nr:acyl-CoA dehydrogenase [Acidobacteria bacterium Mor1]